MNPWEIRDLVTALAAKLRPTEEEQWTADVRACLRALSPEITRRTERGLDTDPIPRLAMRWADDIALGRRDRRELGKKEAESAPDSHVEGTENVAIGEGRVTLTIKCNHVGCQRWLRATAIPPNPPATFSFTDVRPSEEGWTVVITDEPRHYCPEHPPENTGRLVR